MIYGTSRPENPLHQERFSLYYNTVPLCSADVIMTSSEMQFLLYPRRKKLVYNFC